MFVEGERDAGEFEAARSDAQGGADDVEAGLKIAERYGPALPLPGAGQTLRRWQQLAAIASGDLTVARILEPHADALAILAECGVDVAPGRWGVFAAEAPGVRLEARGSGAGWVLDGRKPWCSLAHRLDRALVTAHVDGGRRLFAVDLRQAGVTAEPDGWVARGLRNLATGPVQFRDVWADPVGDVGWYLNRPGFAWGGIGVAACWYGGALALKEALRAAVAERSASELRYLSLGVADVGLYAAGHCLADSAAAIDGGTAQGAEGELLAARVRAVVAAAVERTIEQVGHALGPGPLAFDEAHARRVADLQLYVRQHHAERDVADIGARVVHRQSDSGPLW